MNVLKTFVIYKNSCVNNSYYVYAPTSSCFPNNMYLYMDPNNLFNDVYMLLYVI